MPRPRIALVIPSILGLFAAGCDSNPLEVGDVAAEYVLESVNGSPLPALVWTDDVVSSHLLADTLRLQVDRRGSHVRVHRTDWADPARPDEVSSFTSTLGYRLRGERIEISYVCPPNALCTPGPHTFGRLDGASLVIAEGVNEYRFRRLEP